MIMQIGDCFLKSKRNEATDPNHTNKRLSRMYARICDYFMNSPKKSLEQSTVNTYKSIVPIEKYKITWYHL